MTPENIAIGLAVLAGVEQVLADIPAVKSNSTFQLVCNVTNSVVEYGKRLFNKQ